MTPAEFEKALARDLEKLQKNIDVAIKAAARTSVKAVVGNTPKAFGELRDSVHTANEPTRITVTAPHASAVEIGSRPHVVPLDELIRWVKLRGMQGLTSTGRVKRGGFGDTAKIGPTTSWHAVTTAAQLKALEVRPNKRNRQGSFTPIDAAEQVARRIQAAIAKKGTAPHWYVRNSMPQVMDDLHDKISGVKWP